MSAPKPSLPNKPIASERVRSADLPVAWIMMLGLIVAVGPLSIDMYLPALPSMGDDFGVSTAFMANSVPAYFLGLVLNRFYRYSLLKRALFKPCKNEVKVMTDDIGYAALQW